jgi:tRNA nucleotidyltransferase (CCA-adding enzyme)
VNRIEELGLHIAVDARPILDVSCVSLPVNLNLDLNFFGFYQGRQVVRAIGASQPGAWTGQVLAQVIEWQLGHPDGTMDECEAWLKAEHEAGRIHVEENAVPGSAGKRARIPEGFVTKKAKR